MSEALRPFEAEPLRLDEAWRVPSQRPAGATVHPLRVVSGDARPASADADLRDVIAEIVREELRSDPATGSIRKLVQDEVARIFTRQTKS